MTLPANIRINTSAPFPATVKGGGVVAISKLGNIWTVSLNFAAVAQTPIIADPANTFVLGWNQLTGVYSLLPLSSLSNSKITKILTNVAPFTSPYAAQPTDDVLIVKPTVAAAFTVTVDWSTRSKPLTIVDGKADAFNHNITITPAAGQTQMGTVNYSYIIDSNGGSITMTPLPDATGGY